MMKNSNIEEMTFTELKELDNLGKNPGRDKVTITEACWKNFFSSDSSRDEKEYKSVKAIRIENVIFRIGDKFHFLKSLPSVEHAEYVNCRNDPSQVMKPEIAKKVSENLENLKSLKIKNCPIASMSSLAEYSGLEVLTLENIAVINWPETGKNSVPRVKSDSCFFNLKSLTIKDVPLHPVIIRGISRLSYKDNKRDDKNSRKNSKKNYTKREAIQLKELKFENVQIVDELHYLKELKCLTCLRLSKLPIERQPGWISDFECLETLELSHLYLQELDLAKLSLRNINELILDGCPLEKIKGTEIDEERRKNLCSLSVKNTNLRELPQINTLKFLNCAHCSKIDWENFKIDKYADMLDKLEELDLSYTSISNKVIEELFSNKVEARLENLKILNISNTKIKSLKSTIGKNGSPNLKCLIAENLRLDNFSESLMKDANWQFKSRRYVNKEGQDDKKEYAYLYNTSIKSAASQHFFTGGYNSTRSKFWNHSDLRPHGHYASVIFIGAKGLKTPAICSLFDVTPDDFIDIKGQSILNVRVGVRVEDVTKIPNKDGITGKKDHGERLDASTTLHVWNLSSVPEYRSAHKLFMHPSALYVVVLDDANVQEVQRKADFWYRFVKYSVKTANILFLLMKEPQSDTNVLDFDKFKIDENYHVHRELAYLEPEMVTDEEALDRARAILTHAIQAMPSYTGKIISGWQHVLRNTTEKCEVIPSISYGAFEATCNTYMKTGDGTPLSEKMLKVFRALLVEAGVCYDDGTTLYSHAWFSQFIYATLEYATQQYGKITVEGLRQYLLDNVVQFGYSTQQIKELLENLSKPTIDVGVSTDKDGGASLERKHFQLCLEGKIRDGSEKEFYLFPLFSYIRKLPRLAVRTTFKEQDTQQKEWLNFWRNFTKDFRARNYVNHYVIDMPFLYDGLYSNILCKLAKMIMDEEYKEEKGDDKKVEGLVKFSKSQDRECSSLDGEDKLAIGADGLVAVFELKKPIEVSEVKISECFLMVDGVAAASGRLQIFVGPIIKNESVLMHQSDDTNKKLLDVLVEIADMAFVALFDLVIHNEPLITNLRCHISLPNYYLNAFAGKISWRLPLRDIYFCKKQGHRDYIYGEGILPMELLEKFIPAKFESAIKKFLQDSDTMEVPGENP